MSTKYAAEQQDPGISQGVKLTFGDVWKVHDATTGELITTSGRLNRSNLTDTVNDVIASFQNRQSDYTFTRNGTVEAILHVDDEWDNLVT